MLTAQRLSVTSQVCTVYMIHLYLIFYRRLVSSLAMSRVDLDRERQGAEDLRREIQSYISHVRQVETVLARKV